MQGLGEIGAVHTDLALADQAALGLVHEFDRVLDRQDVAVHAAVHLVDHRRQGRRLARTGLAGHENHALRVLAHLVHDLGHVELFERHGR